MVRAIVEPYSEDHHVEKPACAVYWAGDGGTDGIRLRERRRRPRGRRFSRIPKLQQGTWLHELSTHGNGRFSKQRLLLGLSGVSRLSGLLPACEDPQFRHERNIHHGFSEKELL